ncbi:hypothetical protein [Sphingobacterium corticibacter]|uniref:DUF2283 domain-containing protein n=1 Tax=Sphingobacterium corticibacter TaxID=2171749 RepID=A0A2T8HNS3_9SPHI|nr:hypothetical protein [Sphingobacterium corticibacter]PVH27065.1 hypothetical protein DC487_05565 [Sphingobacterium corticibacter]
MPKTKSAIRVKDTEGLTHIIYLDSIVSYHERKDDKGIINGSEIELKNGKCVAVMIRLDNLIDVLARAKAGISET